MIRTAERRPAAHGTPSETSRRQADDRSAEGIACPSSRGPCPCPTACLGVDELAELRAWRAAREHLTAVGLPAQRPSRVGWCR